MLVTKLNACDQSSTKIEDLETKGLHSNQITMYRVLYGKSVHTLKKRWNQKVCFKNNHYEFMKVWRTLHSYSSIIMKTCHKRIKPR